MASRRQNKELNRRISNYRDDIQDLISSRFHDAPAAYSALQTSASEVFANIVGVNRYGEDWEVEEKDMLLDHLSVELDRMGRSS